MEPYLAIAEDESFEGILALSHPALVSGEVRGKLLSSSPITLTATGKVLGLLIAPRVIILGYCKGIVAATEMLSIYEPAEVHGEIYTPLLSMDKGAKLFSRCLIDPATAQRRWSDITSKTTKIQY